MGSINIPLVTDVDVVIVGAGISGINAAYRLQTQIPGATYTILEERGAIGGTWDLFKYPGIRSDSDLHTFGLPWYPWTSPKTIAEGPLIREYVTAAAADNGIDKKINFHHKVVGADWSSEQQAWTIAVDADGEKKTFRGRFVIMGTGYYDYHEPLQTAIPGLENFKGTRVHPQFWPEDLDYTNKKVAIIGSGATAVTLVPVLARTAANVTMVQRSPTYIIGLPREDKLGNLIRKIFPTWLAVKLVRYKFLILPHLFYQFCRIFPNAAKNMIRKGIQKVLPPNIPIDPTFTPSYNPWEQRLCVCPDGDFYKALRAGKTDIVTGHIKTVTENGILLNDGKKVEADIIVTATGLKMQLAGGAHITVDGKPFSLAGKFMWRAAMIQDLPNAAFLMGYTNASWTLGADASAQLICRLLKHMKSKNLAIAVPRLQNSEPMKAHPFLDLSSTYINKAKDQMPSTGDRGPWLPRSNYFRDMFNAKWGSISNDLQFTKVAETKVL